MMFSSSKKVPCQNLFTAKYIQYYCTRVFRAVILLRLGAIPWNSELSQIIYGESDQPKNGSVVWPSPALHCTLGFGFLGWFSSAHVVWVLSWHGCAYLGDEA
jgi:hypothetical protein